MISTTFTNRRCLNFSIIFSFLILTSCILLPSPAVNSAEAKAEAETKTETELLGNITIIHVNDVHSHLDPFKRPEDDFPVGGSARLLSYLNALRQEGNNPLFLVAGDHVQGTLYFNFFQGEAEIATLNQMGVDAYVLGNHEFDMGTDILESMVKAANFPVLAANIKFDPLITELGDLIKPYVIIEKNGLNIAVIGLVTENLFQLVNPSMLAGITVQSPQQAASRLVKELRNQADVIILLTHLAVDQDLKLAALISDIDIIIGGHSHTELFSPVVVRNLFGNQTVVCQAGSYGRYAGMLKVKVNSQPGQRITIEDGQLILLNDKYEHDESIAAVISGYSSQIQELARQVIGRTDTLLNGERSALRTGETNLANLLADVCRQHTNTDLAVINAGFIRNSIQGPEITIEDVLAALPFDNLLVTMEVRGRDLITGFEMGADQIKTGWNGLLQVSDGVELVYQDYKLKTAKIQGMPIEPEKVYRLALPDFLAGGGDGHRQFSDRPVEYGAHHKINEIFINYLMELSEPITEPSNGRIVILD